MSDFDDDALTLAEHEVRQVVRLLADALAPDDGRAAKCHRLMDGLCRLIDADGWFWMRSRIRPDRHIENFDYLRGGSFTHHHLALYADRSLEVYGEPPENTAIKGIISSGQHSTYERRRLVPDDVWNHAVHQAFCQQMGHHSYLWSVKPMQTSDRGIFVSAHMIARVAGKPEFSRHQARLAHAILSECAPLHADGLNLSLDQDIGSLTCRQRAVLALLIDGMSARQIAERFGLSVHTVQDHVKAIYAKLHVHSRAELLRRFMLDPARDIET